MLLGQEFDDRCMRDPTIADLGSPDAAAYAACGGAHRRANVGCEAIVVGECERFGGGKFRDRIVGKRVCNRTGAVKENCPLFP